MKENINEMKMISNENSNVKAMKKSNSNEISKMK